MARSFAGAPEHLQETMTAALSHRGGLALVDILQPCVSFNSVNTHKWYRERVEPIDDSHDPTDRDAALRLALEWGDRIPIGVIYRGHRKSFESQIPALAGKTLCEQIEGA